MRDVTLTPLFSFAYELTNLNSIVWSEKEKSALHLSAAPEISRQTKILANCSTLSSKKAEAVDVVSGMFSNPPEDARISLPQQRLSHRGKSLR